MQHSFYLSLFIFAVVIYALSRPEKVVEKMNAGFLSPNAAQACQQISSRADEITAQYKGATDLVNASYAWLSPANYKSGDNTTSDISRNIINTDLSQDDITKINNDCKNTSVSVQLNEISNKGCVYCDTHDCSVNGVNQSNSVNMTQSCTINSAIESLQSKTNSVDAMALAQSLQKAQGILSGNNSSTAQNCNIINTDMSTQSYLEQISKCANQLSVNQSNVLDACASVNNVIQANSLDSFQKCVTGATSNQTTSTSNTSTATGQSNSNQSTSGVTALASAVVSGSSVLSLMVVAVFGYYYINP
jgi:hypothetical protein